MSSRKRGEQKLSTDFVVVCSRYVSYGNDLVFDIVFFSLSMEHIIYLTRMKKVEVIAMAR